MVHLLPNLFALYSYGSALEAHAGILRYAALYLLCGVFSIVVFALFTPGVVTVGASGPVLGIMGACLIKLAQSSHCVRVSSLTRLLCLNLALGLLPLMDMGAHVAGLLAGGLFGLALMPVADGPRKSTQVKLAIRWRDRPLPGLHRHRFLPVPLHLLRAHALWWTCPQTFVNNGTTDPGGYGSSGVETGGTGSGGPSTRRSRPPQSPL